MTKNEAHEKRLIDANHIVEVAEHASHEWNLAMAAADGQRQINQVYKMQELCKAVKAVADAAPTVDAVEVVRCKDCANTCPGHGGLVCTIWGAGTDPDGWCYRCYAGACAR